MKFSKLLLMLGLIYLGCGDPSGPAPDPEAQAALIAKERQEALEEIEAANRRITSLASEGKFEEASRHFTADMVQMIAGQPPIQGREAWIATQQQMASMGQWDLELEVLDFEFMGDRAVERGRGVQTFVANESSPLPSMEQTGDYLVLWVRTDEGWKIRWDYVVLETQGPGAGE